MTAQRTLWDRYQHRLTLLPSVGMRVDTSRMDLDDAWLAGMADRVAAAYDEMARVERGEAVNTDEGRRVGHYWLRAPELAPEPALTAAITDTLARIRQFAAAVHGGTVRGERATFTHALVVGIGGSSLGPRFVSRALGGTADRLAMAFLDNTDPQGIDDVLGSLPLASTLTVVISKSGGTKETRNGMLEAEARYRAAGLSFARHAVAVTGDGSELDTVASEGGWLATFPMWDWVGGRTSELSAVGLLPAALQGIDIDALLAGARACDQATRVRAAAARPLDNAAMALALSWYFAVDGRGAKDMVILPYKDRLALLSQYLQQLVMESLGKERDRRGNVVHQGIAVYGNKGSTDQHAYVQQLRDGVPNFFATFIEVLRDQGGPSMFVEPDVTSGDYLVGFLLGTRRALYDSGRRSITLVIDEVTPHRVGALIALYERAVGFYAAMVGINAYHQPGVEAGKKAAAVVIALQRRCLDALRAAPGQARTAAEMAEAIRAPDEVETVFQVLEHLAENGRGVVRVAGATPLSSRYHM